jgi:hypothetical protein
MNRSEQKQQSDKSSYIWLMSVIFLALIPTFWKILAHDYTLMECFRTTFMDLAFSSLLVFLLLSNPLEKIWIYGSLFVWFSISFFVAYPPANMVEILADTLVLGLMGYYIFPNLYKLSAYVIVGLFIAYIFVIRIYAMELDYDAAQVILKEKKPAKVAAEAVHLMCNFGKRYALASERTHWFVRKDDGKYSARLNDLKQLAKQVNSELEKNNFNYVELNQIDSVSVSNNNQGVTEAYVKFLGKTRANPQNAEPSYKMVDIKVSSFIVKLEMCKDSFWRVVEVPKEIHFQAL